MKCLQGKEKKLPHRSNPCDCGDSIPLSLAQFINVVMPTKVGTSRPTRPIPVMAAKAGIPDNAKPRAVTVRSLQTLAWIGPPRDDET